MKKPCSGTHARGMVGFLTTLVVPHCLAAQVSTGMLMRAVYDSIADAPLAGAMIHVLGTEFFGRSDAQGLTATCDWVADGRGALTGYVRERNRGTPLPQTRVRLSWPAQEGGQGGEATAVTDIDGVYRLCGIPANVPVTVEASFLGITVRTSGLIVGPNESRRRDFDIEVIGVGEARVELDRQAREMLADGKTDVQGWVTDEERGVPVDGALVQIRNHEQTAITDPDGRFVFRDVQAGVRVLDVQHLAYAEATTEILLTPGGATDLQVGVRPQAIGLGGIVVTARKRGRLGERTLSLGTRKDVLVRADIDLIGRTSVHVGDLLRRFPGVRVRTLVVGGESLLCVNRGRGGPDRGGIQTPEDLTGDQPECDTLPVFVDGRPLLNPERYLGSLSPEDIESIELVTSTDAAAYAGARNGAIIVYTRGNGPWVRRE